ncbi:hypothetical protein PM082_004715 [Marasmius tenuissimus]|nr:hypothetical protein PM082_004715 [Marasmius tenuissimus]
MPPLLWYEKEWVYSPPDLVWEITLAFVSAIAEELVISTNTMIMTSPSRKFCEISMFQFKPMYGRFHLGTESENQRRPKSESILTREPIILELCRGNRGFLTFSIPTKSPFARETTQDDSSN